MLMDEPFGAIDPINRERLQNEFLRLQAEIRKTVLFVTHDIDEAIKMGDRIAVMRKGGRVAQYATPAELLMAPADEFVEDFVGADRALKRLALMRVSDIDLWEAPLAYVGQPTAEVRAKLEGAEVPYPLLVDSERRPLGWLSERDLAAETVPGAARLAARARCSNSTTSCATRSPTCSRAGPSTRRSPTATGGSPACSRSRSSPSSSARRRRRSRSTARRSGRMARSPPMSRCCRWRLRAKSAKSSSRNGPATRCPARRPTSSSASTGRGKTSTATRRRPSST